MDFKDFDQEDLKKILRSSARNYYSNFDNYSEANEAYRTAGFGVGDFETLRDFETLQKQSCSNPVWAFFFALKIKNADIVYCQEAACKNTEWAFWFASYVPNANIEYCKQHMGNFLDLFKQREMSQLLK